MAQLKETNNVKNQDSKSRVPIGVISPAQLTCLLSETIYLLRRKNSMIMKIEDRIFHTFPQFFIIMDGKWRSQGKT